MSHDVLQSKLRALDRELEDGEITQKGYEKRRTVILSDLYSAEQLNAASSSPGNNGDTEISPLTQMHVRHGSRDVSNSSRGDSQLYPPDHIQGPVGRFQEQHYGRTSTMQGHTMRPQTPNSYGDSSSGTMLNSDYAFNPDNQYGQPAGWDSPGSDRKGTMLSQQGMFDDFAGQQQPEAYGGPQRYSMGDGFSPSAAMRDPFLNAPDTPSSAPNHQLPLEPREIPFDVFDPHNRNTPMSQFKHIGAVLRHRGKQNARQPAYWVLDARGKEMASITWEKLASRAEKVAQVIREKSNLYQGDRVALVYRDVEIIEFAVALMGCFMAGVVAVPINNVEDYQKLSLLLTTTQAHLALTTDNNLKAFHRDISNQKLKWPTGVEWWKTNELGTYHAKKKDETPAQSVPDLAYIEFSRAPTGDLRGVVLSHRTIMHQMACISAIISTLPNTETRETFRGSASDYVLPPPKSKNEIVLSYLDPREGAGLIFGVLFAVYGGHTVVWLESKTVDTPGMYAHLISRYRTTVMVADYPGLKRTAYNYQQDPLATRNFKKNMEPNFASVKICLIDTITVDSEFHEVLADRWLRPMRNLRARELVAPMLCLPEHGGMVVSVRDWLGGEERMGCALTMDGYEGGKASEPTSPDPASTNGYTSLIGGPGRGSKTKETSSRSDLSEVLLDKEALKTNEVVVLAMGDEVRKRSPDPSTVRVGAFGYPIPDATLALVDPETGLLCPPFTVGEIWVDSPSLSGGFWALPKHTESIFHARPYRFMEGNPTPVLVEPEFLRTGLLGCIIEGKVFVLGLYEDRIRQRVEWVENGVSEHEHRHFFVQHLVTSIMKTVPKIFDCTAFDAFVNGEYLPFVLLESQSASTAPTAAGGPPRQLDIPFLDSLSELVEDVLYKEHHLRVYCIMMTAPNTLPRVVKNGRRMIGNMLCRRDFDNGALPCVHVKFGVERAVQNLPLGDDPAGGIWSPVASHIRQEMLYMNDKQYSGVDHREVVIDDRTSTPLTQFSNIHDLMQWRVSRQGDEMAYCTVDARGREGKAVTWRKFDLKVSAVAMYLKNKVKVVAGDHLVLMYTHSEDFVYAVHACIILGVVAVPMAPVDSNRLSEDIPALLHVIADFRIKAIIVNADVNELLKQKVVSTHLKQSALILKVNMPHVYNTTKPSKQSHGCREHGFTVKPAWIQPSNPVIIWTYWTPDQRRVAVQLGHDTIMALCKVQKETCQMTSTRPVLGCVRSTIGLGFLHTCMMGIFLAASTYIVSPVDFAANPNLLFLAIARYKVKDTYATTQMLDHAVANGAGKTVSLSELKNLMISTDQRPRMDVYPKVRSAFQQSGLDRTAINTIYSHVLNPMIASRSYMCIEPIELFLDPSALRRGLVVPVDPDVEQFALAVQDSGMVPVSTQISIVNPETDRLCLVGECGEVWVQSEANAHSFYGSKDPFDNERFNGRTIDGDPNVRYVRTGDIGFLHNVSRPIGVNGNMVDMQVLFVLGGVGETFEVNGLQHFPIDVEASVERCHRALVPGGCAVFQAGSLLVLIAESRTRAYLASIVPVIVNTVLNEHQLVLDIVAFVSKGDFPRSRLGEKQRGKILASWVSRKMQTIAQFSIRDPDGEGSVDTAIPEEGLNRQETNQSARTGTGLGGAGGITRNGPGSVNKASTTGRSSLRNVESVSDMPVDSAASTAVGTLSLDSSTVPQQNNGSGELDTSNRTHPYASNFSYPRSPDEERRPSQSRTSLSDDTRDGIDMDGGFNIDHEATPTQEMPPLHHTSSLIPAPLHTNPAPPQTYATYHGGAVASQPERTNGASSTPRATSGPNLASLQYSPIEGSAFDSPVRRSLENDPGAYLGGAGDELDFGSVTTQAAFAAAASAASDSYNHTTSARSSAGPTSHLPSSARNSNGLGRPTTTTTTTTATPNRPSIVTSGVVGGHSYDDVSPESFRGHNDNDNWGASAASTMNAGHYVGGSTTASQPHGGLTAFSNNRHHVYDPVSPLEPAADECTMYSRGAGGYGGTTSGVGYGNGQRGTLRVANADDSD